MKQLKIKDVKFGIGKSKICISIMGKTIDLINNELIYLKNTEFDVIEWRSDCFDHITEVKKSIEVITLIRQYFPKKPIIYTIRTADEGGNISIDEVDYFGLLKNIIKEVKIDLIDIEALKSQEMIKDIIDLAHKKNIRVILSNHDFNMTPRKEVIIERLRYMNSLKADIAKVAYLPLCDEDVLTLLDASITLKNSEDSFLFVSISMGSKGIISRIATDFTGSCMTFASAKKASAPGQISAKIIRSINNNI